MTETGCARAIAERDRLRQVCPPLAHGLSLMPWFRCRRMGGNSVCGICLGDLHIAEMERASEQYDSSETQGRQKRTRRCVLASGSRI